MKRVTAERADRLEAALTGFREAEPELARALDVLGLSIEEYESGLAGVALGPRVYVSTSSRPLDEAREVESTA